MENPNFNNNELTEFLQNSMSNCYLGSMTRAKITERQGFYEMEFIDGDWSYRDSFTGFYVSTGQEIIRYKSIPVWFRNYGGGFIENYIGNLNLFSEFEKFLIETLKLGNQSSTFMPRGPKLHQHLGWKYNCEWQGDITRFEGKENIYNDDSHIFYHNFFGGLIVNK